MNPNINLKHKDNQQAQKYKPTYQSNFFLPQVKVSFSPKILESCPVNLWDKSDSNPGPLPVQSGALIVLVMMQDMASVVAVSNTYCTVETYIEAKYDLHIFKIGAHYRALL